MAALGGLMTSTFLTLLITPVVYTRWKVSSHVFAGRPPPCPKGAPAPMIGASNGEEQKR